MTVVTILPDGRTISKISLSSKYIASGAGNYALTFTDLRTVEFLLAVNPTSTVATGVSNIGYGIASNVVGLTLNVGANTTISGGEAIAIGF